MNISNLFLNIIPILRIGPESQSGHSMPTHQMVAADPPQIWFKFGMLIELGEK
jgi:hypothetical protein